MDRVAVLASGGLDSCVLLSHLARESQVIPLFVRAGLHWEEPEGRALAAYVAAVAGDRVAPIKTLDMPVASLYETHWSTTGEGVPGFDDPDAAVYLPGRNVLLLGFAAVWCALNGVHRIALGTLAGNPFPDATPEFFASYSTLLSESLGHQVTIEAPFRERSKAGLIREFSDLPLGLTLTCMSPVVGAATSHCGACNKCRERQEAFRRAGLEDPTTYASGGGRS